MTWGKTQGAPTCLTSHKLENSRGWMQHCRWAKLVKPSVKIPSERSACVFWGQQRHKCTQTPCSLFSTRFTLTAEWMLAQLSSTSLSDTILSFYLWKKIVYLCINVTADLMKVECALENKKVQRPSLFSPGTLCLEWQSKWAFFKRQRGGRC